MSSRHNKLRSLKSNAYGNYEVQDPTGETLFYCQKKKFDWYLSRKLATPISTNIIRLTFQPAGLGNRFDPCLLQKLENKCVVCGTDEDLTKHHIVPYCYRQYMAKKLGHMNNFDVLPVCVPCHDAYEIEASKFKKQLVDDLNVPPIIHSLNTGLYKLKRYIWALQRYKNKIPPDRIDIMYKEVAEYLDKENITLDEMMDRPHRGKNLDVYESQSDYIVQHYPDLDKFAIMWRKHFLEYTQPKFLPQGWKPEIRNAQGKLK